MTKCNGGCEIELSAPEAFPQGSYCSMYCCGCCPDNKASPCQKEKRDGSMFDELRRTEQ